MSADEERFTVAIWMGNAAMLTEADVAHALRAIAGRLEAEPASGCFETIHDANGNDVGRWKLGFADRPGRAAVLAADSPSDYAGDSGVDSAGARDLAAGMRSMIDRGEVVGVDFVDAAMALADYVLAREEVAP